MVLVNIAAAGFGRFGQVQRHKRTLASVRGLMKTFAVSADQLLNEDEKSVVNIQDHELNEQLALINQLDDDEKKALVKIINSMLTKKRMKDLLNGKIKLAM